MAPRVVETESMISPVMVSERSPTLGASGQCITRILWRLGNRRSLGILTGLLTFAQALCGQVPRPTTL
jgi:hypothetical protein